MNMNLGNTIKRLRRERDMTQEELAELLSITPQAISRWENDSAMPDISLVPRLCNIFDISSDTLLGIDVTQKQKKIKKTVDLAYEYMNKDGKKTREILENALREYPDSDDLMLCMMWVSNDDYHTASDKNEYNQYLNEVIYYGEKILKCRTAVDDNKYYAIQLLCSAFWHKGDYETAKSYAMRMPPLLMSREFLLGDTVRRTELLRHRQKIFDTLFGLLVGYLTEPNCKLDSGEFEYTAQEVALLRGKAIALIEIMFEDDNYRQYNVNLANIHLEQAKYYAINQDAEKTLHHLEKAAACAVALSEFDTEGSHTSLYFRGLKSGNLGGRDRKYKMLEMLEALKKDEFDFIRMLSRFIEIEKSLGERT